MVLSGVVTSLPITSDTNKWSASDMLCHDVIRMWCLQR